MPNVARIQAKRQSIAGVMRISPEGTLAAWYEDNNFNFHFHFNLIQLGLEIIQTNALKAITVEITP